MNLCWYPCVASFAPTQHGADMLHGRIVNELQMNLRGAISHQLIHSWLKASVVLPLAVGNLGLSICANGQIRVKYLLPSYLLGPTANLSYIRYCTSRDTQQLILAISIAYRECKWRRWCTLHGRRLTAAVVDGWSHCELLINRSGVFQSLNVSLSMTLTPAFCCLFIFQEGTY